jgi:hypothetical protein
VVNEVTDEGVLFIEDMLSVAEYITTERRGIDFVVPLNGILSNSQR